MNIEDLRNYCLSKKATTEELPFDEQILCFKVLDKVFALTDIENFQFVNMKCDPEKAVELREQYDEIRPAYHMNKKHWNSVYMDASLSDQFVKELVDHSYEMVVHKMTKKQQKELSES